MTSLDSHIFVEEFSLQFCYSSLSFVGICFGTALLWYAFDWTIATLQFLGELGMLLRENSPFKEAIFIQSF